MSVTIVGLGPAGLDLASEAVRSAIRTPGVVVVARTTAHPAIADLEGIVEVIACDDLYETLPTFDDVYLAIAERVTGLADAGRDVVYAVPGSPMVGERTVPLVRRLASDRGHRVAVLASPSFLDLVFDRTGIDPITDGVQVLDARELPDPLPLHVPTVVTQVDTPLRAADLAVALGKVLGDDTKIGYLDRLGDPDEVVEEISLADLASREGGPRASVVVPRHDVGLLGLIATNRILRAQCPWDRKQTHHTLLGHLLEEAYEAADAVGRLPVAAPAGDVDFGAYAEVEDELGDLLLQVVFHATLASEAGAFDIDEVAELNRRKLVRRHPHVFGDVDATDADQVLANWERIKGDEKARESLMDDVPAAMPAIARAVKVQKRAASVSFDWDAAEPVLAVLDEEIDELRAAMGDPEATAHEVGDVLFTVVNLARHLRVDPETALRASVDRFMTRFRAMESALGDPQGFDGLGEEELDALWHDAKRTTMGEGPSPGPTPEQSP